MEKTMPDDQSLQPEFRAIEREHARNIRLVSARPWLGRIFSGVFIGSFALAVVAYAIVVIGYVIAGSFTDMRYSAQVFGANGQAMHAIVAAQRAEPLSIGAVKVVQGTPSSYDVWSVIQNQNDAWYATYSYTFTGGGMPDDVYDGFVLPKQKAYALALGVHTAERPSAAQITVFDVVWHHVDRHDVVNIDDWLAEREAFHVADVTYVPDLTFDGANIGRTTFAVTNATPYAYWTAQFLVTLERAGSIVGISAATVNQFEAGETRTVDVRWYDNLPTTAQVSIVPVVNYFDEANRMPPRGQATEDIRDSLTR